MNEHLVKLEEVRKALTVINGNNPFEIRILDANEYDGKRLCTYTGYFTSVDKAIEALSNFRLNKAKGFYCTINPIVDTATSISYNKFKIAEKTETTNDKDITKRNWFFVDFDAIRKANTNASDAEKIMSRDKAHSVYDFLKDFGFSLPVIADSGNGVHLLYRIDLPTDSDKVKRVLDILNDLYSDDKVKIDTTVVNPARITKLYGTKTCKGGDCPELTRTQRFSRLVNVPEIIVVTPESKIDEFIKAYENKSENKVNVSTIKPNVSKCDYSKVMGNWSVEKVSQKILSHAGDAKQYEHADGTSWEITCPFHQDHTASVKLYTANNTVSFHCFHERCQGKKLHDVLELYKEESEIEVCTVAGDPFDKIKLPRGVSSQHEQISEMDIDMIVSSKRQKTTPCKILIEDFLHDGITFFFGDSKIGKSVFGLRLAESLATGLPFLGKFKPVKPCKVIYYGFDMPNANWETRLLDMDRKTEDGKKTLYELIESNDIRLVTNENLYDAGKNNGGNVGWGKNYKEFCCVLDKMLTREPEIGCVIVDVWQKIDPTSEFGTGGRDAYKADYAALDTLRDVCNRHKICAVLLHHTKKSTGHESTPWEKIQGSMAKIAAVNNIILISKISNNSHSLLLEQKSHILKDDKKLALEGLYYDWNADDRFIEFIKKLQAEEITKILYDQRNHPSENGDSGSFTIGGIQSILKVSCGMDVNIHQLKIALELLLYSGKIVKCEKNKEKSKESSYRLSPVESNKITLANDEPLFPSTDEIHGNIFDQENNLSKEVPAVDAVPMGENIPDDLWSAENNSDSLEKAG